MISHTDVIEISIPRTLFGVGAINKLPEVVKGYGTDKVLVITDKGRCLRQRMWPVYAQAIQAHLGTHLCDSEADRLAQLLGKLQSMVGKERE